MGARRKFLSGQILFVLFGLTSSLSSAVMAQGEQAATGTDLTAETLKVAKQLSENTGIPLSTALTDLVTKAATLQEESGLGTVAKIPDIGDILRSGRMVPTSETSTVARSGRSDNGRSEYDERIDVIDSPIAEIAITRGYTPREIEFDPLFQTNVSRAATAAASAAPANRRSFGGMRVPEESDAFPDVVAVTGNNRICSGTLVAADKVLTAAHCYCDGAIEEVILGQDSQRPIDRIPVDIAASEVFLPCNEINSDLGRGDIALLKLTRPAAAEPRRLTSLQMLRAAAAVRAVGFGRRENAPAGQKFMVDIVIASYQCDGLALTGVPDDQVYRCRNPHELVAASLNRDTCGGDSGGPVFVFDANNEAQIAGVTSRAIHPSGKCGPGGIYVIPAVEPIRQWLEARGISFPN